MNKIIKIMTVLLLVSLLIMRLVSMELSSVARTLGLLVLFLLLLISEIFPVFLTCMICIVLMPMLGVANSFSDALSGFSNQVIFFVIASFGIASSLIHVSIQKRLLLFLLRLFGKNINLLILGFMICSALISAIISNVSTCAIFIALVEELMMILPKEKYKEISKALMIGVSISSMVGGVVTPIGSSINLLALYVLKKQTGLYVSFAQWMCIGIPIVLCTIPIAWFIIINVFDIEEVNGDALKKYLYNLELPSKLEKGEIKVIVIMIGMITLWILSSWVTVINIMHVALVGSIIFCLPKIGVITSQEFLESVNWESVFLVGTVLSISNVVVQSDISGKMLALIPTLSSINSILVLAFIAVMTFISLSIIPVAPSLVTLLAPAIIQIAIACYISPCIAICVFAICLCNCYLLPLDTVCVLTYSKGYYEVIDLIKVSLPLQMCLIFIVSLVSFFVGKILNWI